jgi:hypothetical protein
MQIKSKGEKMRIVRVVDHKPCYQLEKKLQNQFMRYSGVKFLTLEPKPE